MIHLLLAFERFMLRRIKHIIWDYNGTLLDDRKLCVRVINELLIEEGLPLVTEEEYMLLFDFPVIEYYRKLGFRNLDERFDELGHRFIEKYENGLLSCKLHRSAKECIKSVAETGYQQSVLSARHEGSLRAELNSFGLTPYFSNIFGLDNHLAPGKLEQAKDLIARTRKMPDELLLVGDTLHDAEIALITGMQCVLLTHGHFHVNRLKQSGFQLFNNFISLKQFLCVYD